MILKLVYCLGDTNLRGTLCNEGNNSILMMVAAPVFAEWGAFIDKSRVLKSRMRIRDFLISLTV